MSRHETLHFRCDGCDLPVGLVENDLPDDQVDTHVPPGWAQVILRMARPNPDYGKPAADAEIDSMLDQMLQGVPDEQKAQARAVWEPLIARTAALTSEEPTHLIEEIEVHLCLDHALEALGNLAPEALLDAGWIVAAPAVAVAEAPVAASAPEPEPEPEPTKPEPEPEPEPTKPAKSAKGSKEEPTKEEAS